MPDEILGQSRHWIQRPPPPHQCIQEHTTHICWYGMRPDPSRCRCTACPRTDRCWVVPLFTFLHYLKDIDVLRKFPGCFRTCTVPVTPFAIPSPSLFGPPLLYHHSTSGSLWIGCPFWFPSMMSRASGTCRPSTSAETVPRPPAPRAVRPALRTYSDGSRGKSNMMTCSQYMQSIPVQCSTEGGGGSTRSQCLCGTVQRGGRRQYMQHSQCLQSAAVFQGMRNEGRLTPMWDCGAAVAFTLRASLVPSLLPPPIHSAPPPAPHLVTSCL